MRAALATLPFAAICSFALPLAADAPEVHRSAAVIHAPCNDPSCGQPALTETPKYSEQIPRDGDFAATISVHQPCSCVRRLNFLVAFTPAGTTSSREQTIKIDVPPGTSTQHVALRNAELAKGKVAPGRYTVGFKLYDERDRPLDDSGLALSGHPFTFGTSREELLGQPKLPQSIGRDAELSVPFAFGNTGDIATNVTALLAFTRPDSDASIEFYTPNLVVKPGKVTHVVRLTAAKRRELKIGAGPWLVTVSAFDGAGKRLAFYPGHLLMIGETLSVHGAPEVTSPLSYEQDLGVTLRIENDGDSDDLVTGYLQFSRPQTPKPIEYKVEGIRVAQGSSEHTIVLRQQDRYDLGIRPGRWQVKAAIIDRAGKRTPLVRGNDLVLAEQQRAADVAGK